MFERSPTSDKTLRSPSQGIVTPPKTFGRFASKRFVQTVFESPSMRESEWTRARETARRARLDTLDAPLALRNGDIFGLVLRFLREMEFTTHATAVSFHTRCFTGKAFVKWAMEQSFREQTFRDEADAVFLANELLLRGIIAPVARGQEDAKRAKSTGISGMGIPGVSATIPGVGKAWRLFRGGDWLYTVKTHDRGTLIAACFKNSTEEEKNGIRECVGRLRTLKYLVDGDSEEEQGTHGDASERGESERDADDAPQERASTSYETDAWKRGAIFAALFARIVKLLRGVHKKVDAFFSTLGPHIGIALASLLFMVKIQNFAFACVLAVTFMRHLLAVSERQVNIMIERTRADMLRKFQMIRGDPKVNKHGAESADWWSAVLQHMWEGWLGGWLSRLVRDLLQWTFESLDLPFVSKIELSEFRLGTCAPLIKTSRTFAGTDDEMIVEWDLTWQLEDSVILVSAMFGHGAVVPIPIRVRLSDVRLDGNLRLTFTWIRVQGGPYVRSLRVSFVGLPTYDFSLKIFGAINLNEVGMINQSVRRLVDDFFRSSLVEPEGYFWDVNEWWHSFGDGGEEQIDPRELIDQALMKDIERFWRRGRDNETTVELRAMPIFAELDLSGKNASIKAKYFNGEKCRMYVAMEYGRKRFVSKAHIMSKHLEAVNNELLHPTWEGSAFAKLDTTDDVVNDCLVVSVLAERVGGNQAKRATTKLLRISRKVIGVGKFDGIVELKAGGIHDVETSLVDPSTLKSVGTLRVRLRVNVLKQDIVVEKDSHIDSLKTFGTKMKKLYAIAVSDVPRSAANLATSSSRRIASSTSSWFGCFGARSANGRGDTDRLDGKDSGLLIDADDEDDHGAEDDFTFRPPEAPERSPNRPFGVSPSRVASRRRSSTDDAATPRRLEPTTDPHDPFYDHIDAPR